MGCQGYVIVCTCDRFTGSHALLFSLTSLVMPSDAAKEVLGYLGASILASASPIQVPLRTRNEATTGKNYTSTEADVELVSHLQTIM